MALPRSEDVIMLTAVNMFYAGAYSPEPTFLYRRWPGQITQQEWWIQMQPLVRSILWQRQAALLALIGQSGPCNECSTHSGPVDSIGCLVEAKEDMDLLRDPRL